MDTFRFRGDEKAGEAVGGTSTIMSTKSAVKELNAFECAVTGIRLDFDPGVIA